MNDYYLELIRQKPINYNGLIFYPVEFGYICDNIGLDIFDKIILPFLITKESLNIDSDLAENMDLFDDIIIKDQGMLVSIVMALQLFCKCKNAYKSGKTLILEFNESPSFEINTSNYNDICKIIMLITNKDKLKVEKPPKNMSDKQRDIWEKLQKGREREAKKNTVHIYDVLNICEFGGAYRIPQEEIEKWTLWRIMNCYKARLNMKIYEDNLKICLVSGDGKSISGDNHWHHKLLIRE